MGIWGFEVFGFAGFWDLGILTLLAFWHFEFSGFFLLVFGIFGFWDYLILGFRDPKFLGFWDFPFLRLCDVVCMGFRFENYPKILVNIELYPGCQIEN